MAAAPAAPALAAAPAAPAAAIAAPAIAPEEARQLLKALADPLRLELVQVLAAGERCVCDLTDQLGLAQSRLSFHLRVMREAGLIEAREQGRWVYYRLRPEAIAALQAWLAGLACTSAQAAPPCC